MEGTQRIIIAHYDPETCVKFAKIVEDFGYEVSAVKSSKDILKKIEVSGTEYGLMGLPLEQMSLKDVEDIREFAGTNGSVKLFAITSAGTKFSRVLLEKIKVLKPKDFISDTFSSDEITFRLSNIIFENSGLRKNQRGLLNMPVHCDYMQDFFDAQSFTISKDGLFLKTDRRFERSAKLFLTFSLPDEQSEIATMGNVLYQIDDKTPKPRISPKGAGVYFVDLDSGSRDVIDKYIKTTI